MLARAPTLKKNPMEPPRAHFLINVFLGVAVSLLKVPGTFKTSGRQMLSRGHMYCKYHDLFGLSMQLETNKHTNKEK